MTTKIQLPETKAWADEVVGEQGQFQRACDNAAPETGDFASNMRGLQDA